MMHRPAWVEYVAALLLSEESAVREVGSRVWELSNADDILEYLTSVMTEYKPNTRAFEVAWDVWALLWGRPA